MLIHLYSNQQAYGDSEVWCGSDEQFKRGKVDSTDMPEKATCHECPQAACRFGERCTVRRGQLLTAEARAVAARVGEVTS